MQRSQTRELAPVPHFPYFTIAVTLPQCSRYCTVITECYDCIVVLVVVLIDDWSRYCCCLFVGAVFHYLKNQCVRAQKAAVVCVRALEEFYGLRQSSNTPELLTTKQDSSQGRQRVISPAHDCVTQCYISLRHRGHWQPLQPQLSTSIRAASRGAPAPVTVTLILCTWPTL